MILAIILFLSGIKPTKQSLYSGKSFEISTCVCLKGICAVYLMFGHYSMHVPLGGFGILLAPVQPGAILLNGLFFFISGYGLMTSAVTKLDYLRLGSYLKRTFNIGVASYISYLIAFPFFNSGSRIDFVRHVFLLNLFRWFHLNDPTWFLIELVFLYTFFWILYSRLSNRIANLALVGIIVFWYIIAIATKRGVVWYGSTLCFALGIYAAKSSSEGEIERVRDKQFYSTVMITSLVICFIVCVLYNRYSNHILIGAILCNIASLLFCFFVYMFLQTNTLYNKALEYLGKISFEVYLVHIYMIEWTVGNLSDNVALWVSILLTFLIATMMHLGIVVIKRICRI